MNWQYTYKYRNTRMLNIFNANIWKRIISQNVSISWHKHKAPISHCHLNYLQLFKIRLVLFVYSCLLICKDQKKYWKYSDHTMQSYTEMMESCHEDWSLKELHGYMYTVKSIVFTSVVWRGSVHYSVNSFVK